MNLKKGSVLQGGKYRIIRMLGQGGFGITYLAENTFLDKKVAIKEFFPKDFCGRDNTSHLTLGTQNNAQTVDKLKERFIKEARNIARLDHPGIVRIHDVFEENNTAYYVMEYIEGESLNDMVKRYGPLPQGNAIRYIRQVGEALEYIHSRNMTHFDVKPANIVVRRSDDYPILIDFGLSKQYDAQGDATSTLMQAVSHGYAPMEQYNNQGIISFSPQTDVYSLSATLLFLVTGKVPPQASAIIEDGLEIPANIDPRLGAAIEKGMAPARKNRFATVADFLAALPDITPVELSHDEETQLIISGEGGVDAAELAELRARVDELGAELKRKDNEVKMLQAQKAAPAAEPAKTGGKWKTWFFVAGGALLISLFYNFRQSNAISNLEYSRGQYLSKAENLTTELEQRNRVLNQIAAENPLFIYDVEVRNDGEEYGEKIYSKNTTYINPRFKYINLSDSAVDLGVKFYSPYGLTTGDSISYGGYSYFADLPARGGIDFEEWAEIVGWGNDEKGKWGPGKYRIELWANGKCAATKSFTIY